MRFPNHKEALWKTHNSKGPQIFLFTQNSALPLQAQIQPTFN